MKIYFIIYYYYYYSFLFNIIYFKDHFKLNEKNFILNEITVYQNFLQKK